MLFLISQFQLPRNPPDRKCQSVDFPDVPLQFKDKGARVSDLKNGFTLAALVSMAIFGPLTSFDSAWGQAPAAPASTDGAGKPTPAAANVGDQIVVKREVVRLLDTQKYRLSLTVDALQRVEIPAPFDGTIRQVAVKPNQKLAVQVETMRFESTIQRLQLDKAKSFLRAMTLEQKLAAKTSEEAAAIAQAKMDAAKADVDLAQYYLDLSSIRAPFACEVQRIHVVEGQFVRAGEPLIILGDPTKLVVEVPADGATLDRTKNFPLKIADVDVEGKIEAVLPLSKRFDPLRDLLDSATSVIVVIDNSDGKFKPGQTVYVPVVPRQPVTEVANSAILNTPEGNRRVQVVRANVVRDIPVSLLGPVGSQRTYVTGDFTSGDEVIYSSSHLLADGFVLKPAAAPAGAPGAAPPAAPNGNVDF